MPKIHKSTRPLPGRPILSANQSPTEQISAFVDYFLKPTIPHLKSYDKDTIHFLQILQGLPPLPPNSFLVTLDVTSLYTNIPNKEGIRATAKILAKYRPGAQHLNNQSLTQLLDLVVNKNNFEFNGEHYLQTSGTAMGTRLAPSFANTFTGNFENTNVYTNRTPPLLWLRFINDFFMIWIHDEQSLTDFTLHTRHQSIKFTSDISKTSINFLDTTVSINPDGTLATDLYTKPTDSHNYLLYNSSHPVHCKTGLSYSQFLRIRQSCSDITDFDRNAPTLTHHFKRRGYPENLITSALEKARSKDRQPLLSTPLKPPPVITQPIFSPSPPTNPIF